MKQDEGKIKILLARVEDAVYRTYSEDTPKDIGFLNLSEQQSVTALLRGMKFLDFSLFGGYEGAERVFLRVGGHGATHTDTPFPLILLKIFYRQEDVLTHRDFLGSILSLGVTRAAIGDILITEGEAFLFVEQSISQLLLEELSKIGRTGVSISLVYLEDIKLPTLHKTETLSFICSSLRLDQIVATITKKSRSVANEFLRNDFVSVNFSVTNKGTKLVENGDYISVRGFGRFQFLEPLHETKKGNLKISVLKYI